jgi:hypothetical protein
MPTWSLQNTSQNFYPFVYVLKSGDMFMLIDRTSRVITQDGECKAVLRFTLSNMIYRH